MDNQQLSASPVYSIRLASKLCGVAPHTLRIWERRYGHPRPVRSDGGVRLYTGEDVRRLAAIGRAVRAGHRPGKVMALSEDELRRLAESPKIR